MRKITEQIYKIDVHHHILPSAYLSALDKLDVTKAAGVVFPKWDLESSLKFMDKHDIATTIVSVSAPGVYFGDSELTKQLARQCNEFTRGIIQDHPQRFGAFATLPLPDLEASLVELTYALDELQLDGIALLSNIDGQYLGDTAFNEIYAELNRRQAVVFVHPNAPPKEKLPNIDVPPAVMEFVFDTTRAVANLVQNRTLRRYPDIKFIFPHAGGVVPYLAWRISFGERRTIKYLKRLYYDVAVSSTPYALRSLQELADPTHILFGSDYPFLPDPLVAMMVEGLKTYDGFDSQTRRMIERENALTLFPRFKSE